MPTTSRRGASLFFIIGLRRPYSAPALKVFLAHSAHQSPNEIAGPTRVRRRRISLIVSESLGASHAIPRGSRRFSECPPAQGIDQRVDRRGVKRPPDRYLIGRDIGARGLLG